MLLSPTPAQSSSDEPEHALLLTDSVGSEFGANEHNLVKPRLRGDP
jgi:hypothetical protein